MATRRFGAISTALLDNLEGGAPPTVNDDVDAGYGVGSVWYDTVGDVYYVCVDSTADTAVWVPTGTGAITPSVESWGGITNVNEVRALDTHITTIDTFADVLGTLIDDLVATGILA